MPLFTSQLLGNSNPCACPNIELRECPFSNKGQICKKLMLLAHRYPCWNFAVPALNIAYDLLTDRLVHVTSTKQLQFACKFYKHFIDWFSGPACLFESSGNVVAAEIFLHFPEHISRINLLLGSRTL